MSKPAPLQWLMLLAQLPASPSSARVSLWRRLRAAGATGLFTGAWVLPLGPEHQALFEQMGETVRDQGGQAAVFVSQAIEEGDDAVVAQFAADRAREYGEFAERCDGLLAEIAKERGRGKFTFAELEEIEDDLEKLTAWLAKIEARDFFPDVKRQAARDKLGLCRSDQQAFAEDVYAREGLGEPDAEIP